ncbi:MAG: hypothetical protein AAFY98_01035 [Verrucomicrobiota bacterium]
MKHLLLILLILFVSTVTSGLARTSNGNEFALALIEAKDPRGLNDVFEEAKGRPHFFRYLQIMEMEEVDGGFQIVAFEPSSYLDVKFSVDKSVSLSKLKEDPRTKKGDAIAILGRVTSLEDQTNAILLDSVIVKHKDRLSPVMGKELLGEVDPGATFYSYTHGPRPVHLESRDRDLLSHRDAILKKGGPEAWTVFLETEIAKRKEARAAAAKEAAR